MRCQRARSWVAVLALLLSPAAWPAGAGGTGGAGRSVQRTVLPDGFGIAYRWTDAQGTSRTIDLRIQRAALEESERGLGFSAGELRAFIREAEVRVRKEHGLSALDIARQAVSETSDPSWCRVDPAPADGFEIVLKTDMSARPGGKDEIERIVAAYERRWESSHKKIAGLLKAELRGYAGAHGLELTAHGLAADYRRLVRASAARLKPVAEAFRRAFGPSRAELLAALHSFVQAIPYKPLAPVDDGRYCAGVRVPLRVLVEDGGDCDSKAVLFAALWTQLSRYRVILIRVPDHMLVGLAVPFVRGASVVIHGLRYALLEVSCSGPTKPGEISRYSWDALAVGNYRYTIVS
jgi:hypothetical protein